MKQTNTLIRVSRSRRHSFKPLTVPKDGRLVGIYTGVPARIAKLIQAEAAIHNKSVASLVNSILEARYSNIK